MLMSLKALVVVLFLATVVFFLAKPICLRFTEVEDFVRRRNIWYVLTIVAFLSPSFWLYVLAAMPLLYWAGKKDSNPVSLFLFFFFVIPNVNIEIPVVGINRLFEFNNARLLCLVVLLPAVTSRERMTGTAKRNGLSPVDWMLLAYGVLQIILFFPYESYTNTVRRSVLFLLDIYLVYFACSRLLQDKRHLTDAMAAFALSASLMALIGCFESVRSWLLYVDIAARWGDPNNVAFLLRGDSLRAQVSTGHSLTLGYVIAMALGFWMYLKSDAQGKLARWVAFALFSGGLLCCYSRGPWLTAVLVVLISLALASSNSKKLIARGLTVVAAVSLFAATPFGASAIDSLPFIGTRDQDTVEYRRQLFETSWVLIKQHPLLGNPFVLLDMESLRQGQGIIDLVNGYLQVALFYGLLGLTFFVGVHVWVLGQAFFSIKTARAHGDEDSVALGAVLIACVVSNLFFMATAGQTWGQWAFAGILASYVGMQKTKAVPLFFGRYATAAVATRHQA